MSVRVINGPHGYTPGQHIRINQPLYFHSDRMADDVLGGEKQVYGLGSLCQVVAISSEHHNRILIKRDGYECYSWVWPENIQPADGGFNDPDNPKYENARFWEFYRGDWVKLTLKPGQRIRFGYSYSHEEGWSSYWAEYHHDIKDGHQVIDCTIVNDGSDCDGRLTHESQHYCPIEKLQSRQVDMGDNESPKLCPDWEHGEANVYDQYAEAAGY